MEVALIFFVTTDNITSDSLLSFSSFSLSLSKPRNVPLHHRRHRGRLAISRGARKKAGQRGPARGERRGKKKRQASMAAFFFEKEKKLDSRATSSFSFLSLSSLPLPLLKNLLASSLPTPRSSTSAPPSRPSTRRRMATGRRRLRRPRREPSSATAPRSPVERRQPRSPRSA